MKEVKVIVRDVRKEVPEDLMREYEKEFANFKKIKEDVKKDPDECLLSVNEEESKIPKAKVLRIELQRNQHDNTKVTDHQCDICKKYYAYKQSLINHISLHYKGPPKLPEKTFKREVLRLKIKEVKNHKTKFSDHQCNICEKYFATKQGLKGHIEYHFKPPASKFDIINRCDKCNVVFSSRNNLRLHMLKKHKIPMIWGEFTCDFCGCGFESKQTILSHIRMCSKRFKKELSCDHCDKKFTNKSDITIHMKSHAVYKTECKICHKKFSLLSINFHMRANHSTNGEKFQCTQCPKFFKSSVKLQEHLKVHDKKFQCSICAKKFSTRTLLNTHNKFHENPEEFRCKICQHQFTVKGKLKRHMKTHDKNREKNFKCSQCIFKTDNSSDLKKHLRTHDKNRVKRFKCQRCDYSSDDITHLKSHIKSHEIQDEKLKKLPNAVRCHKCLTVLQNLQLYERHLKFKHQNVKKFECNICQKSLTSKKSILNHFIVIHKINL